jgi:hypothetical protein
MKGLILKDIMCLKRQLMIFVYVMIGVIVVSIMYVLSARFGNLSQAHAGMLADEDLTSLDIKNIGSMALVMFMLLPIATVGDLSNVFVADGKAGFARVGAALPVPLGKRVVARFLTIYALLGIGVLLDLIIAAILAPLTDIMSFGEFFGVIFSAASIMGTYSALVIFFCLLFGYGKEQLSQILAIFSMLLVMILCNLRNILRIAAVVEAGGGDELYVWGLLDFLREKAWILVIIAACVSGLSLLGSLLLARKKRGVI